MREDGGKRRDGRRVRDAEHCVCANDGWVDSGGGETRRLVGVGCAKDIAECI